MGFASCCWNGNARGQLWLLIWFRQQLTGCFTIDVYGYHLAMGKLNQLRRDEKRKGMVILIDHQSRREATGTEAPGWCVNG
jgi:hypothetical protein